MGVTAARRDATVYVASHHHTFGIDFPSLFFFFLDIYVRQQLSAPSSPPLALRTQVGSTIRHSYISHSYVALLESQYAAAFNFERFWRVRSMGVAIGFFSFLLKRFVLLSDVSCRRGISKVDVERQNGKFPSH